MKGFKPSEPLTLGSFPTSSLHQRPIKQNVFRLKTDSENVDKPTDIFFFIVVVFLEFIKSERIRGIRKMSSLKKKDEKKTFICQPSVILHSIETNRKALISSQKV